MSENNKKIKIEEMFKAGVHFGYSRTSRHPKMEPSLFGLKNNVEIFDLEKVYDKLENAKNFMKKLGEEKKLVLFTGTKIMARPLVSKYAQEIMMPFVAERWIGGTLTNFKNIRGRIDFMNGQMQKRTMGAFEKYTKKERLDIDREIEDLRFYFESLNNLKQIPAVLIAVDTKEERSAVLEAKKLSIPVISLMNSDCNIADAKYPIPGNDNSATSIELILKELVESYKEGLKLAK